MQEKQLEKFIVFVESMRGEHNEADIDVIMEGFFATYGNKGQFNFNDKESAMRVAMNAPNQISKVWPKLYAKHPEILMAALQHPDVEKSKVVYEFIKKFMKDDSSRKGTLGEIIEKGVKTALKSDELKKIAQTFLTKRIRRQGEEPKLSRTKDKAVERAWAAGREEEADKILSDAGM